MTLQPRIPHRTPDRHPESIRRVRVTAPRPARVTSRQSGIFTEVDESTLMGETYVDGLVRSQLRLSLMALVTVVITLAAVFIMAEVSEPLWMSRVRWVPPAWICFGPLVYFAVWWVARLVVSHAEDLDTDCQSSLDPVRGSLHQDR